MSAVTSALAMLFGGATGAVFAVFSATQPVPEPSAPALLGAGALLLGGLRYLAKRRPRRR